MKFVLWGTKAWRDRKERREQDKKLREQEQSKWELAAKMVRRFTVTFGFHPNDLNQARNRREVSFRIVALAKIVHVAAVQYAKEPNGYGYYASTCQRNRWIYEVAAEDYNRALDILKHYDPDLSDPPHWTMWSEFEAWFDGGSPPCPEPQMVIEATAVH